MDDMKKKDKPVKLKIVERKKVCESRYGTVKKNNRLEPHEEDTVDCLTSYGFDVETIIPSNIPRSKNPDILMLGTFWEMKGPRTTDEDTIATRFRKAVKQANGKAIFDLRNVEGDAAQTEKYIMKLFATTRGMRRLMIIKNNNGSENLLDIFK